MLNFIHCTMYIIPISSPGFGWDFRLSFFCKKNIALGKYNTPGDEKNLGDTHTGKRKDHCEIPLKLALYTTHWYRVQIKNKWQVSQAKQIYILQFAVCRLAIKIKTYVNTCKQGEISWCPELPFYLAADLKKLISFWNNLFVFHSSDNVISR